MFKFGLFISKQIWASFWLSQAQAIYEQLSLFTTPSYSIIVSIIIQQTCSKHIFKMFSKTLD